MMKVLLNPTRRQMSLTQDGASNVTFNRSEQKCNESSDNILHCTPKSNDFHSASKLKAEVVQIILRTEGEYRTTTVPSSYKHDLCSQCKQSLHGSNINRNVGYQQVNSAQTKVNQNFEVGNNYTVSQDNKIETSLRANTDRFDVSQRQSNAVKQSSTLPENSFPILSSASVPQIYTSAPRRQLKPAKFVEYTLPLQNMLFSGEPINKNPKKNYKRINTPPSMLTDDR